LALLAMLTLTACAVGPDYRVPKPEAPATWSRDAVPPAGLGAANAALVEPARWWTAFADPGLDAALALALTRNHDLRLAAARIAEARAARRQAGGTLGPTVTATTAGYRERYSENGRGGFSGFGGGSGGFDVEQSYWKASVDASWELDLFGGLRRGVEAADADLAAIAEARRGVLVLVLAETARAYLDARTLARRVDLASRIRDNLAAIRERTRSLAAAGLVNAVFVAKSDGDHAAAEALVPQLMAQRDVSVRRLDLLLAQPAGTSAPLFTRPDPTDPGHVALRLDLPAELVRQRPDLRQAERELAAATARIGVASADLYPRLSLTGSFGFESASLSDLFTAPNRAWSIGPAIRWPVFSSGRVRAAIGVQEARTEQALLRWEQAVLRAFSEVEDALSNLARERERHLLLTQAYAVQRDATALAEERYAKGVDSEVAVLEQRRLMLEAEDRWSGSRQACRLAVVALAQAVGGGWEEEAR